MGWFIDQNLDYEYSPTITKHKAFETFIPIYQIDSQYSPSVFIDSPGARGATMTTKKEASASASQEHGADLSEATQQDLFTPILILAGLGVGGYILVNLFKKGK